MVHQQQLIELAPTQLVTRRAQRYDGGGFGIELDRLDVEDRPTVQDVYRRVRTIYDMWLYTGSGEPSDLFQHWIPTLASPELGARCRAIGRGKLEPEVAKVVHDLRGGALMALLGYAEMVSMGPEPGLLKTAIRLARDHAKLMRNALIDIDPPIRAADESVNLHPIRELLMKWDGLEYLQDGRRILVEARTTYDGDITTRCLETSAVDRILYNLINNAARFTVDDRIRIDALEVAPGIIRWVVQNRIAPDQWSWLDQSLGNNLGRLFEGGVTRGGQGIGLTNCADFVKAAFGLSDSATAIASGYIGARRMGDAFWAWFHWPSVMGAESSGGADCSCAV